MNLAERYQEQAKWARTKSDEAATPEQRQQWLDVARQYELLAAEHIKDPAQAS